MTDRIEINPNVMLGKPVIIGPRDDYPGAGLVVRGDQTLRFLADECCDFCELTVSDALIVL